MKVLITGIHGFVGSNLVKALSEKHTVYGLDIKSNPIKGVVQIYNWSNLDNKTIPEIDVIIHLAGKAHDTNNQISRDEYFSVNTGLTKRIFDYFLCTKARKFIFFSSVKAAADKVADDFLTETVIPSPKGPYGESKIAAEKYIQQLFDLETPGEKMVYILRPCMIHGPGNKGNLNLLYKVIKKGIPWPLGSFENRRSFLSVENLCYIINNLITNSIPSGIYHLSDDEAISTNELIKVMCKALKQKPIIWHLPSKWMIRFAKLGGWLRLPLNRERLRKLTENYVVSNKKIKTALNIEKLPVSAMTGLMNTFQSFRK